MVSFSNVQKIAKPEHKAKLKSDWFTYSDFEAHLSNK